MDSRKVATALNKTIKNIAAREGFLEKKVKSYWKRDDRFVAVLNFESFSSHYAKKYGCTSYSLAVNIGLLCKSVANCPWQEGALPDFPKEYECHARLSLKKSPSIDDECDMDNIWNIFEDGSNLDLAISDILLRLSDRGFPWLNFMMNEKCLLERFQNEKEWSDDEAIHARPYSPSRASVVCGILIQNNNIDAAISYIDECLEHVNTPASKELLEEYRRKIK